MTVPRAPARVSADFKEALAARVLPARGEEYSPEVHDAELHRLDPIRAAVRRYAAERGVIVHPTQADRLRDLIRKSDWTTDPWGHIGVAKWALDGWIESGEDMSAPWEAETETEGAEQPRAAVTLEEADPEARRIWERALERLQERVTRPNFETWLTETVGVAWRGGEFTVSAPNAFVAETLDQRMYSLISIALEDVLLDDIQDVRFCVYRQESGA